MWKKYLGVVIKYGAISPIFSHRCNFLFIHLLPTYSLKWMVIIALCAFQLPLKGKGTKNSSKKKLIIEWILKKQHTGAGEIVSTFKKRKMIWFFPKQINVKIEDLTILRQGRKCNVGLECE